MSSLVSAIRTFQRMAEEPPQEFKPGRKCKGPRSEAAKKNLMLDSPKLEGTKQVPFDEIVLMIVGGRKSSQMVLLRGYSSPNSAFYKKTSTTKTKDETKPFEQTHDTAATKKTTCT